MTSRYILLAITLFGALLHLGTASVQAQTGSARIEIGEHNFSQKYKHVETTPPPPGCNGKPLECYDGPGEQTFSQVFGIHVCPEGYALRGVHLDQNRFLCRRTAEPATDFFVDYGTQRGGMHACPNGTYVRGLQVDKNLLVCAYDRRRGFTQFSSDEKEDRCPKSQGGCSQQDGMHISAGSNQNAYVTGFDKEANTYRYRTVPTSPSPVQDPVEINIDPSQPRNYLKHSSSSDLFTWQKATRNWLARILNVPPGTSPTPALIKPFLNKRMIGGVKQQEIRYYSPVDQKIIDAWLSFPPGYDPAKKYPAVLVTHGHGVTKEDTATPPGTANHAVAFELAKQGAITLAVEVRGFGQYTPFGGHDSYFKTLYPGQYPQFYMQDNLASVSLLLSILGVDPEQLSVVGLSLGGYQALWLGALDPRVKKVVVAGLYLSQDCLDNPSLHHGCQAVYALKRPDTSGLLIDTEDLAALIAPRPLLATWGTSDHFYKDSPHKECRISARDKTAVVYQHLHIDGRFGEIEFAGGH